MALNQRQIIIKLYGIINGGHLEATHLLGDLGRMDDKRIKEKERVGEFKLGAPGMILGISGGFKSGIK